MNPIAKLCMSCLHLVLTDFTEINHLRAGTQADFWLWYKLKDLTVPADYCTVRAQQLCWPLALAFIDLEKRFDSIDRAAILNLLHTHYHIHQTVFLLSSSFTQMVQVYLIVQIPLSGPQKG